MIFDSLGGFSFQGYTAPKSPF